MIRYHSDLSRVSSSDFEGFFENWHDPPSPETHHRLLAGSTHFVAAVAEDRRVIGYITTISDGVLSAYISHLEVLPGYRHRGIGSATSTWWTPCVTPTCSRSMKR